MERSVINDHRELKADGKIFWEVIFRKSPAWHATHELRKLIDGVQTWTREMEDGGCLVYTYY